MTTISRYASLGFVLIGSLALASCSVASTSDTPSEPPEASALAVNDELAALVPEEIRAAGVIRMALNPTYPPFESTAADGSIVGLDPDLAHAIGEVLDLEIEFVPTSFDAIIPALQANDVDMAMSSIGDTIAREEVVDFATYYWNGTLVLVADGNPLDITPELACGTRIGVVRGSLQQNTFLPAQSPRCEEAGEEPPVASAYQDVAQAILALQSDRIDGVMADAPPMLDAESKNDGFETAGPLLRNPNPGGVALPKGSGLVEPVNGAINLLIEDGTYAEILDKWGLGDIAIETSEINGAIE